MAKTYSTWFSQNFLVYPGIPVYTGINWNSSKHIVTFCIIFAKYMYYGMSIKVKIAILP